MASKLKGLVPRHAAPRSCNICWQGLSEERPYTWWHGRPYHIDCFDKEMTKPLHLRFKKKKGM